MPGVPWSASVAAMKTRHLTASLLSVLAVGAAAAPPALADSISYIKDGDVWLTTPDGSRHFQVTTSGAYSYASQADDGTFIALAGERLHRLDRLGNVTADFATPVTDGPPPPNPPHYSDTTTSYFHGPFEPEISPDGKKVSYTYFWQHYTYNYILNVMENRLETGTAITHADRLTGWDEFGGHLSGWRDGSWIDDTTLMRSDAGIPLSEHAVINKGIGVGQKSELVRWFREGIMGSWDMRDPELTRDGSKLAMVVREPEPVAWHVRVSRTTGPIPAAPEGCFRIVPDVAHSSANEAPTGPTWSPDGRGLAFTDGEGIHVVNGIDLSGACQLPAGASIKLLVPGAAGADWGPADVPAGRPAAPAPASGPAAPAAPAKPGVATTPRRTAAGVGAGAAAAAGSGASAMTTAIACRRRCTVSGRMVVRGKTVARGTARSGGKGTVRLTLKPTAAGRKVLARLAGRSAAVKITVREGKRTRRLTRRVKVG